MIIRVTFNDNDYKKLLESQFKYGLLTAFFTIKDKYKNDEEKIAKYITISKFQDNLFVRLFKHKNITTKQKEVLINILKEAYTIEIENNKKYLNHKKYLLENLSIEIINSYKDKDENGEVLYYFATPDTYFIV